MLCSDLPICPAGGLSSLRNAQGSARGDLAGRWAAPSGRGPNGPGRPAAMKVYIFSFATGLLRQRATSAIREAVSAGNGTPQDLTSSLYLFSTLASKDGCPDRARRQAAGAQPTGHQALVQRTHPTAGTAKNYRITTSANAFYSACFDTGMTISALSRRTADSDRRANNKLPQAPEAIDLRPNQKTAGDRVRLGGICRICRQTFGQNGVGLTISKEQRDLRKSDIQAAGLNDHVENPLQGLSRVRARPVRSNASIEMIEAVGEQFWPTYVSKVRDACCPRLSPASRPSRPGSFRSRPIGREATSSSAYVLPGGCCLAGRLSSHSASGSSVPVIRERIFRGKSMPRHSRSGEANFRRCRT